jgi:hypothetical protein
VQLATKGRRAARSTGTVGAVVLAVALMRCAPPPHAPSATSLVVSDAAHLHASIADASTAFDRWLRSSAHGDTFAVYVAGLTAQATSRVFLAAVPARWGTGNVLAEKAAFVRNARAAFLAAMQRGVASGSADAGELVHAASPWPLVLPSVDSTGRPWEFAAASTPIHDVLLCDASSSGLDHACTPAALLTSYDRWIRAGAARAGSTFTVLTSGRTLSATATLFTMQTPQDGAVQTVVDLLSARSALQDAVNHMPEAGSAIAEGLFVGVNLLRERAERGGLARLYVLSDLREVSDDGEMNLEEHVPSAPAFAAWMHARGLSAPAQGIEVTICGVHTGVAAGSASLTPQDVARLREAWSEALTAWHPASLRICSDCAVADLDARASAPINTRG